MSRETNIVDELRRGTAAAGERLPRPEQCLSDEERRAEQLEHEQWENIMGLGSLFSKLGRTTTQELQDGGSVCDADSYPADALGITPEVNDEQSLVQAMKEISWGTSRKATVEARAEQLLSLVRDEMAQDLQLTIHDEQVATDDRLLALKSAALNHLEAQKKELFAHGKTLKYSAGEITLRDTPLKVTFDPDKDSVVDKVIADLGDAGQTIIESVQKMLSPFVLVKFTLDAEGIKRSVKAGALNSEGLSELGIIAKKGEAIAIKPYDYQQRQVA